MRAITEAGVRRRNNILLVAAIIVTAGLIGLALVSAYAVGQAHADSGSAVVTAGSGSGSGSSVPAIRHVTEDPIGYADDLRNLWHQGGWSLALMLGIVGLCEILALLGKGDGNPDDDPAWKKKLAWLGKGRVSIVIGAVGAGAMTVVNAALAGGKFSAAVVLGVGAFLSFWHQAGLDPAKR